MPSAKHTFISAQDPLAETTAVTAGDSENPFDNPFANRKKSSPTTENPAKQSPTSETTESFDNPFGDDPPTDHSKSEGSSALGDESNPFETDDVDETDANVDLDESTGIIEVDSTDDDSAQMDESGSSDSQQSNASEKANQQSATGESKERSVIGESKERSVIGVEPFSLTNASTWADNLGFSPWYLLSLLIVPVLAFLVWRSRRGKIDKIKKARVAAEKQPRGHFRKATRFSDSTIQGGDSDIGIGGPVETKPNRLNSISNSSPAVERNSNDQKSSNQLHNSGYVFVGLSGVSKELGGPQIKVNVDDSGLFDLGANQSAKDVASLSEVPQFSQLKTPIQPDINTGLKLDESSSSIDFNLDNDDDDFDFLGDSTKLVGDVGDSQKLGMELEDEFFSETKEEEFDRAEQHELQLVAAEEDDFVENFEHDEAELAVPVTRSAPGISADREQELLAKIESLEQARLEVITSRDLLQQYHDELRAASIVWQNEADSFAVKLDAMKSEHQSLSQANQALADSLKSAEAGSAELTNLKTQLIESQSQSEQQQHAIETLQAEIEELKSQSKIQQASHQELTRINQALADSLKSAEAGSVELTNLQTQLIESQSQSEQQQHEIETLQAKFRQLQSEMEALTAERESLMVGKSELANRVAELESAAAIFQNRADESAALERRSEQLARELSQKSAENAELVKKLNMAQRALSAKEVELEAATVAASNSLLARASSTATPISMEQVDRAVKEKFTKLYRSYERERKLRKESEQKFLEAEKQRETISQSLTPFQQELAAKPKSAAFSNSMSLSDLANDPDSVSLDDLTGEVDESSFSLFLEDEK